MKLESVLPSKAPQKRYTAIFSDGEKRTKTVHFGSAAPSKAYIDHHDKAKRDAYLARHRINETWSKPTTPGSLSRHLLWGEHTGIRANVLAFKRKFKV